ncbi:hypothetical protein CO230_08770 [Chryseobacterium sp. 6424]|uniref:hypothetical protein n=1 Tax=Chryseobacterium sp. 6424 TaxID=2039166 RepID=UPI000EFA3D7D|nr:hypothetical protein [Chryseobacterium sp. 6424]AYO58207.1 hypothetical protein CO230_08770 [Chryseobacterium sp. 6424]
MKTTLLYSFHKDVFDLDETVYIEFENPPYIPESKEKIDIDFHSFFDEEIADQIVARLEANENIIPYRNMSTWSKTGVNIHYEYMDIITPTKYRIV